MPPQDMPEFIAIYVTVSIGTFLGVGAATDDVPKSLAIGTLWPLFLFLQFLIGLKRALVSLWRNF